MAETALQNPAQVAEAVQKLLRDPELKFWDIHTHLFPPQASSLVRFGVDELLNYHTPTGKCSGSAAI